MKAQMCVFGVIFGIFTLPTLQQADHAHLLRTAKQAGIEIKRDPKLCNEVKGLKGYFSPSRLEVGLCSRDDEPKATLRHELIHAVQLCLGDRKIFRRNYMAEAQAHGWNPMLYPEREWPTESEARVLEHEMGDGAVAELLITHCIHKPHATR